MIQIHLSTSSHGAHAGSHEYDVTHVGSYQCAGGYSNQVYVYGAASYPPSHVLLVLLSWKTGGASGHPPNKHSGYASQLPRITSS
jgi:hypothetical protein